MFSLKPGLAYYALSIAISVVVSLLMIILFMTAGKSLVTEATDAAKSGNASNALDVMKGGGGVMLLAVFLTVSATFFVSDKLMPPLCRWSSPKSA